jgi:hypothetical protein
MRDRTHTRNLIPAEIEDLFARAGLAEIELYEEAFTLDFNEWFDRGTPAVEKLAARHQLLDGPKARGFAATREPDGSIRIECQRTYARGILPDSSRGDAAEISGADRDEVLG